MWLRLGKRENLMEDIMTTSNFGHLSSATLHRSVRSTSTRPIPAGPHVRETLNAALKARLSSALAATDHPELLG